VAVAFKDRYGSAATQYILLGTVRACYTDAPDDHYAIEDCDTAAGGHNAAAM
jgi:hypothetical protein